MAEMSTLNGYEVVDKAARERLDILEAGGTNETKNHVEQIYEAAGIDITEYPYFVASYSVSSHGWTIQFAKGVKPYNPSNITFLDVIYYYNYYYNDEIYTFDPDDFDAVTYYIIKAREDAIKNGQDYTYETTMPSFGSDDVYNYTNIDLPSYEVLSVVHYARLDIIKDKSEKLFNTLQIEDDYVQVYDAIDGAPFVGLSLYGKTFGRDFPKEETLLNKIYITYVSGSVIGIYRTKDGRAYNLDFDTPDGVESMFGFHVDEDTAKSYVSNNETFAKCYTDSRGALWISDEMDFESGKFYKRCNRENFNGSDDEIIEKVNDDDNDWLYRIKLSYVACAYKNGLCDRLPGRLVEPATNALEATGFSTTLGDEYAYVNIGYYMTENTVEEFRNVLAQYSFAIFYPLATPIEMDMPEKNIENYKDMRIELRNTGDYGEKRCTDIGPTSVGLMCEVSYPITKAGAALAHGSRELMLPKEPVAYVDKLYNHFGLKRDVWPYLIIYTDATDNAGLYMCFSTYLTEQESTGKMFMNGYGGYFADCPAPNNMIELVDSVINNISADALITYKLRGVTPDCTSYNYYTSFASKILEKYSYMDICIDGTMRAPKNPNGSVNYGTAGQVVITNGDGTYSFADGAGGGNTLTYADQIYEAAGLSKGDYPYLMINNKIDYPTNWNVYFARTAVAHESYSNTVVLTGMRQTGWTSNIDITPDNPSNLEGVAACAIEAITSIGLGSGETSGNMEIVRSGCYNYLNFNGADYGGTTEENLWRIDVTNEVSVPTKVSELENDAGYITADDVNGMGYVTADDVNEMINSGSKAYDTQIYEAAGLSKDEYPYLILHNVIPTPNSWQVIFGKSAEPSTTTTNSVTLNNCTYYGLAAATIVEDPSDLDSVATCAVNFIKGCSSTLTRSTMDMRSDLPDTFYIYANFDPADYGVTINTNFWRLDGDEETAVPTKVSELENDAGYITADALTDIETRLTALENIDIAEGGAY